MTLLLPALLLAAAPTFHRDIEPVLQSRCQSCHRPGEIGKMPLLTYGQVRPWAKAIRQAVLLRKMPPWFAESSSVQLANDPRLSREEIRLIDAWVRAGAPKGSTKDAPPPRRFTEGWNIPNPDMPVSMPEPYIVPARDETDYQYVILPLNLQQDRWVSHAEIRPGARGVVHHAVAYIREPTDPWLRDHPIGKPFPHGGATKSDILAIYTPGQQPMICPPGTGKLVPAGSDIVLQMHYTPAAKPVPDQTSIGIVFLRGKPERRVLTLQIDTTEFRIPPGESNHRVTASGTLPHDARLLSLFPHLHLRGKAFEYEIVEPGGRIETLLRVAPYDFYWQLNYILAQPRLLRAGTRLRVTAWYDNSPNNARNPDPAAEVAYGERSSDEMMIGFFDVAVDPALDKPAFFRR